MKTPLVLIFTDLGCGHRDALSHDRFRFHSQLDKFKALALLDPSLIAASEPDFMPM
jgi:hypothetical protein